MHDWYIKNFIGYLTHKDGRDVPLSLIKRIIAEARAKYYDFTAARNSKITTKYAIKNGLTFINPKRF